MYFDARTRSAQTCSGRFHFRVLRVDHADETDLRHAVRVRPAVLAAEFVDTFLVRLAGELDQE